MHIVGLLKQSAFLGCWCLGTLVWPTVLYCMWHLNFIPLYVMLAYYTFRVICPAEPSTTVRKNMSFDSTPYYNTQKIVFDDGAAPPAANSNTMFAVAPHGVLTQGFYACISSEIFYESEIKWLIAEMLFHIPFCKDFMYWGSAAPCTPPVMKKLMATGANVALLPGGFEEATLYKHGVHRLYIKNRQGFIKYALQYGYNLQLGYVFGEELCYWTVKIWPKLMLWLNKFKIPGVVFIGKFLFLPNPDLDMYVVIGKPLELPHIENPTKDDVNKYHKLYMEKMTELFNKYKGKFAKEGEKAEVHLV